MSPRAAPRDASGFFAPRDPAALAAALAWADANAADYSAEVRCKDKTAWLLLRLPAPRIHPCAPDLFAAAAGVAPGAIRAVLEGAAFTDDDGALRLWPWYPEEDATERPLAERAAADLGIELPCELLDEPYEPAHYLARTGSAGVEAWLARRGIDPSIARIDRVPIPPPAAHPPERYEGGGRARSRVEQAIQATVSAVEMFAYATEGDARAYAAPRLDGALDRLVAALGGPTPVRTVEPQTIEAPIDSSEFRTPGVGHALGVFALHRGALVVCEGALVELDRDGALVMAWPRPMGELFARGDVAIINGNAVLDLAAGRFLDAGGDLAPILAQIGLGEPPSGSGHDQRTAPVISACGRYLLDVDESPHIVRLADGVTVAEDRALEGALEPPKPSRAAGLVEASAVEVATPTIIDGVRFTVRAGQAPVRDGRSLELALAGNRWRFLVGNVVRERTKTIARLGVPIATGAFRDDGQELWALTSDHAIRVELEGAPRVATIVPLEPVLLATRHLLSSRGVHDA